MAKSKAKMKSASEVVVFTSADLVELVRARYSKPEMVVFEQLASGTGRFANSWIDVAVVHLWPSQGCSRMAFELKISRSDFLSEMNKPAKNDWARKYFHEFWYVAPVGVILDVEEVPERCGWLAPTKNGKQLRVMRQAGRKESPVLDDVFLASLCRSAQKEKVERIAAAVRDTLHSDAGYTKAKLYQSAAEKLFIEAGLHVLAKTESEILDGLRSATGEGRIVEDREQILGRLGYFQDKIFELFLFVSQFAHVGLMERDALGAYVIERWGESSDREIDRLGAQERKRFKARVKKEKRIRNAISVVIEALAGSDGDEVDDEVARAGQDS